MSDKLGHQKTWINICFLCERLSDHLLLPPVRHWAFQLRRSACFAENTKGTKQTSSKYMCKVRLDWMHTEEESRANKANVSSDWVTVGNRDIHLSFPRVFKITVSSPVHNLSGRKLPQLTGPLSATGIEAATGALPVVKKLFSLPCADKPVEPFLNQSDDCTTLHVWCRRSHVVPEQSTDNLFFLTWNSSVL